MPDRAGLTWVAGSLLALALLATACSGGSDKAAKDAGGSTATTTAADTSEAFCAVVSDQFNLLSAVDLADVNQLKAFGEFMIESNAELLAATPSDLRSALATQVKISNAVAEYHKRRTQPPPEVTDQVLSPEFMAASAQVAAYEKDRCGFEVGVRRAGISTEPRQREVYP